MIPNITIGDLMIDCANAERACNFYANLLGYEKIITFNCPSIKTDNGLTILFAETDIPYVPPVWPEESGKQQKQMHLDFTVTDLPSSVEKAIRLGATKAVVQYGGDHLVTMIDTEGHPFCLCEGSEKSESINIDCQKQKPLREFYAQLTGWDKDFHWAVLLADNGMIVCFQGCDVDATMDEHIPPVWPEQSGKQQKQMHFNFQVDALPSAVDEAIRIGATKAIEQYGGENFVTMIDTEGHPFCLCRRV